MFKKQKKPTISERVAEILNEECDDSSHEDEETVPTVAHFTEEDYSDQPNELSRIRKKNIRLLSEQSSKYKGEVVSRKELESENESEDDKSDLEELEYRDSEYSETESEDGTSASEESLQNNESSGILFESQNENLNTETETYKGLCVQNQLTIWEKLLEIRIHSQKIVNKANSLPPPDLLHKVRSEPNVAELSEELKANTGRLLENLLELQACLSNQSPDFRTLGISAGKRKVPPTNNETSRPPKQFASTLQANFDQLRSSRNSILLKWEDRTKVIVSSNRAKASDKINIVSKINNCLLKKSELIAKSQKIRTIEADESQQTANSNEDTELNPNVYDDSDFYHSQLRELIEFKSNSSGNASDLSKQFIELQKLRHKMKKRVDTRSSKGRKIRYVVHNKLLNFMAPSCNSTWTDDSKDELYRSLFVT